VSDGTHSSFSPNPHGITVQGYDSADSYIYPGGALFQFINPINDFLAPEVTVDPPVGGIVNGLASDDRPDDTGIFFIELEPGSVNLQLTTSPFVPGDPTATFTVSLIDSSLDGAGSVVVTDGAGNVSVVSISIVTGPRNCCEPHGGLGCCNLACEDTVCTIDPTCCDIGWDQGCANLAKNNCGNLCRYGGDTCCPTCPDNPCVDGARGADLYHDHCDDPAKFIQCNAWGKCFEMPCAPGTVWNDAANTCVHAP